MINYEFTQAVFQLRESSRPFYTGCVLIKRVFSTFRSSRLSSRTFTPDSSEAI